MTPKTKIQLRGHRSLTRVTARRKMASLRVSGRRRLLRVTVKRARHERLSTTAVAVQKGSISTNFWEVIH